MCCDMTGLVFDIQRFSLNDGPGIRTTIFLKGCPLHCAWCHNPESQSFKPELMLDVSKCIGCGKCFGTCTNHRAANGVHNILREVCTGCGKCADVCPSAAIELVGNRMTVISVVEAALKDRGFWGNGGGVTVTGGEPLAQPDFTLALLRAFRAKGIHTAIETSGFASREVMEKIAENVDMFLYDIKETDSARHQTYVGCDNRIILDNLRYINDLHIPVWLRCPMIPEYNAREEHLAAIADLANELSCVERIDIEPYHPLGKSKAKKLDKAYLPEAIQTPDKETVSKWLEYLRKRTKNVVLSA